MEMIKVKSSNIQSVGYENEKLYVQYNSGLYLYEGVKKEVYNNLLQAESKGHFISTEIRGKYNYKKLDQSLSKNK